MSEAPNRLPVPTPDERRSAAERFTIADQWLAARQPERAVPLLDYCCQVDPGNLIYRQALRTARRRIQTPRGLFSLLKKWTTARCLQTAQAAHDWPAVLILAETLLAMDPNNPSVHLALASAFEAVALPDHAVWCLEHALETDRADATVPELARLYERTGRFSKARKLFESAVEMDLETKEAVNRIRDQIVASPGNAQLYLQLIRLYRSAGDSEAARDWLARGLTATANDFELALEQARLELDELRLDLKLAEQRSAAAPDDNGVTAILARLRHEIQARAIDICRQTADRYPSEKKWRLELGILLLKSGQFDAALEEFEQARNDEKLAWRALVYSGYCHLNSRRWRKAEPLFTQALPHIPPEESATRNEVLNLLAQHATAK